ncbi:MAG TPA: tetratricopeptide repeat protein, partial [Candidatus Eisenbacteria bacterium]
MSPRAIRRAARRAAAGLALALAAAAVLSSCAYYNTFYLARKYYDTATLHQPYLVDKPQTVDNQNFGKSMDYSKKVLGQYPNSKWADDAYLLWARALLGRDDPVQTVNMLQDFERRYPKSPIRAEAKFYLGVGYRQARKYKDAANALDEFLALAPKHDLAPYAYLERARALASLQDYPAAAASADNLLDHWPKSRLRTSALIVRADANFKNNDFTSARKDYRTLGLEARDDEERLSFLMREADCLEQAQAYDEELALLKGAQSHEAPPPPPPEPVTTPIVQGVVQSAPPVVAPANDRYGRLMVRIATVYMLQGKVNEAVSAYTSVVRSYPRTPLAAEAQYRVGYCYETAADDFDKARAEYAKVRDIAISSYMDQANQRLANLDRIAKFHSSSKDTVEAKAEAAFLVAEQYLFQINKPDRALDQYRKIEQDFTGTPWAAKAIVAQAWVLSRKLGRKAEADSLFWIAVREHPATEAQLAARDYLEMEGAEVPAGLIQLPVKQQLASADTMPALTPVPQGSTALGGGAADSLGPHGIGASAMGNPALMQVGAPPHGLADSTHALAPGLGETGGAPAPHASEG